MLLPRNARIAVIDDDIGEALPLLRSLSRNGFATTYFSGLQGDLPSKPLSGLRIVFLDMDLGIGGYTGAGDKSKAAATANVFKSVVDTSTTSTCLVAVWSKHQELIAQFWEYVNKDAKAAFIQISLDKAKCMAADYALDMIEQEIENAIRDRATFRFFVNWENLVHQSSDVIVTEFASSIRKAIGSTEDLSLATLRALAVAHAGKNLDTRNETDMVVNAMLAFSGVLRDSLESCVLLSDAPQIPFAELKNIAVPNEIVARINSKLLISAGNDTLKPGNMYLLDNLPLVKTMMFEIIDIAAWADHFAKSKGVPIDKVCEGHRIAKDYEKELVTFRRELTGACRLIYCESSPYCDYAQRKWEDCRLIHGLLVPGRYAGLLSRAPFLFSTPLFELDGQAHVAVFNMRRLITKTRKEMENAHPVCCMRYDLLVDLQHRIGSHCSRPGFVAIPHYLE